MPTTTRQRLVESALRRFYREGFRSVGLDQVLTDLGISKTAFYKHFQCKEHLMLAAGAMAAARSGHARTEAGRSQIFFRKDFLQWSRPSDTVLV